MMKKILLILCSLLLLNISTSQSKTRPTCEKSKKTHKCIQPEFLKAGDRVALISPSYYSPLEEVQKTAQILRQWGLEPVIGPNVGKRLNKKYAGSVEERVEDIRWAMNDPTIKAIICNRGGYGSIHFIDYFSLEELRAHPKWVVGFSDISTIHGLLTCCSMMSIHGTMGIFLQAGRADDTSIFLRELLKGTIPQYFVPAHPFNIQGSATGTLVGGNICTFAPNLKSQADATSKDDIILFIEEVEESMHNIDRQMQILKISSFASDFRPLSRLNLVDRRLASLL
ncbi:MAG: LD-carboxypeptidase [Alistipes sp.]|nr:LD-carboxypeptidase [Candidatus Alistipes equi]